MLTAHAVAPAGDLNRPSPTDAVTLPHDERHLRRKRIALTSGESLMIDLPQAVHLHHGDRLVTEGGQEIEIVAADEALTEIRAHDPTHHASLCWHIGNRHLKAQIEPERILILRDPVIHTMLEGLGATLRPVDEPFHPMHGAYHSHNHSDGHAHAHSHGHAHG